MATGALIDHADHRATALTPRGVAVLAILRLGEELAELDAADRDYLAPYAAELLVDIATDVPFAEVARR